MAIVPHLASQTYLLERTPVNQSDPTNLRKSSRSRQTPNLRMYECEFPSYTHLNTTARSYEQNQQVSQAQVSCSRNEIWKHPKRTRSLRDMVNEESVSDENSQLRNHREVLPSSPTRSKEAVCSSLVDIEPLSSTENSEALLGPRKPSSVRFQNHDSFNFTFGSYQQSLPSQNPNQQRPNPNLDSNTSITVSQSGIKRKATAPLLDDIIRKPVDDFFYNVCQATCSSTFTLNQHLEGRRHKANLARSQEKRIYHEVSTANNPKCNVCQIWCMDKASLEMHFKGKKHNAKLQELGMLQRHGVKNAKITIRCELCLVYCMNDESFNIHVNGKAHTARVELARRGV